MLNVLKKIKYIFLVFPCFLLALCACIACKKEEPNPPGAQERNTLMIYMCGSDLETKHSYASLNIEEMLSASTKSNNHYVVMAGGANRWTNNLIKSDHLTTFEISNGEMKNIEYFDLKNMGEASTLRMFLDYSLENYPADNYSLIMWDHGGGILDGVCADEKFDFDALSIKEIEQAIRESSFEEKLDFIGMDACLMANYSVAHAIIPFANYFVASEELEFGTGWDYNAIFSSFGDADFYDKILHSYSQKHADKNYYTLSVVELEYVYDLTDFFVQLSRIEKNKVVDVINASIEYGGDQSKLRKSNLYDMGEVASKLGINIDLDFIKSVAGAYRDTSYGLTFYFPLGQQSYLSDILSLSKNDAYNSMLKSFFSEDPENTIVFENEGDISNGGFFVSLTEESKDYFSQIYYRLFRVDGHYFTLGSDNDIITEGSKYSLNFVGNWVFLNGHYINCEIIDKTEAYTKYISPVLVNGERAHLCFIYTKEREAKILGYTLSDKKHSRLNLLQEGDKIDILHYDVSLGLDGSYYIGHTVYYSQGLQIEVEKLPDGDYYIELIIEDIYGNTFQSLGVLYLITNGLAYSYSLVYG